jgi:hypothetical protein
VFVPVVSRGAVNAGAGAPARHWPALRADAADVDDVFFEHRLALELVAQGLCEAVSPVFLGDELPGGARGGFFAQGCAPPLGGLPAAPVAAVEAKLARQLHRLGLDAPGELGVREVWRRVSERQGCVAAGALGEVVAAGADAAVACVRRHTPGAVAAAAQRASLADADASDADGGAGV